MFLFRWIFRSLLLTLATRVLGRALPALARIARGLMR
jgi:hypothetical protein